MISVLILTRNEEVNLPQCLESVGWSDDVVVFDSFSQDKTTEIARDFGARVVQRQFDNYGAQREAARTVEYKYPWLLSVDADERPDEELVKELGRVAAGNSTHVAYRVRRKDHFRGKWIKHSTLYPSWFVRLFQHKRVRYEARSVHEHPNTEGSVGRLEGHLLHYSFNKGLSNWLSKHVRYAQLEAKENLRSLATGRLNLAGVFSGDPVHRRRTLKEISFRLPFRPTLRFLYMYVARGGFLDGSPGLTYCRMLGFYEYMIVLQMNELRRREKRLPI